MQTEYGSKNAYDWLKSNADDIEYTFNYLKQHNIEDDQEALNSEISKTYDEKMYDVHPDPNISDKWGDMNFNRRKYDRAKIIALNKLFRDICKEEKCKHVDKQMRRINM